MSTASGIGTAVDIGVKIGGWIVDLVGRFINGDDSEEVRRVVDILPAELKADVMAARKRRELEEDLRADLGGDS